MINESDVSILQPHFLKFTKSVFEGLEAREVRYRDFFRESWPVLNPGQPLIESFLIDCICEYLEAVDMGQIRRLIINVPPRSTKSSLVSVAWPVWSWSTVPWSKWIFSSYDRSLAIDFSLKRRTLIESPWFQKNWGSVFALNSDQNQKSWFENDQRGVMYTTSTGSGVTGRGGDRIIIDDPLDPLSAESKSERERANEHFSNTLYSRLDNKRTGVIVLVMQRLHKNDLTGYFMGRYGEAVQLSVPQMSEKKTIIALPVSGKKIIRDEGSFICPERYARREFEEDRVVMGTRAHEAQHQQNPRAEKGGLLPSDQWRFYRELPEVIRKVWSWDTAIKTGQENDFTVGLLIAECALGFYVCRYLRRRMKYPELKARAQAEYDADPGEVFLVEDKSSGQQLIQDFKAETRLPVIGFSSDKDKVTRASLMSPTLEAGRIFLPEGEPWVADFIERCSQFPDVDHDDEIDALTQGILYLTGKTKTRVPGIRTF